MPEHVSYPELVLLVPARFSCRELIFRNSSALLFFNLSLFSFNETSLDLSNLQFCKAVSRIICLETLSELATSGMQALSSSKATLSSFLRCRSMWLWTSLASSCFNRRLSSFRLLILLCICDRLNSLFTGELSLPIEDVVNTPVLRDFEEVFLMMWNFCCFNSDLDGSVQSFTLTQNLASPPGRVRIFLSKDWDADILLTTLAEVGDRHDDDSSSSDDSGGVIG